MAFLSSQRLKLLIILTISCLFCITYAQDEQPPQQQRLPLKDVQRFTMAISQIKNFYVKNVEDEQLFEDAIRGMLQGLDPHSSYLNAEEFKALQESTSGEFGGLGIEVTLDNGLIKVISPIDDTPAAKAGLQPGDLIARINQEPVKGMTLQEAVKKMRGKPGTDISVTIIRKGEAKPLEITLTRAIIKVASIKGKILDKHYGYIRISHFQANSAVDLAREVDKLRKKAGGNLRGLILDMRNNPGGLLDAAVDISDSFIHNDSKGKEEIIVYTKGRIPGTKFIAEAKPGDIIKGKPIVVLINSGSASGSEIVAGALQDHDRALVVGQPSFGKGSVQTVLPLDDKTGVKLTTALYYTPDGRSIQAKGIKPDIAIENVKLPELSDAERKAMIEVSEANLGGHLEFDDNGKPTSTESKKKNKKAKKDGKNTTSLYDDYQLHQALNLLKSMSLMHSKKSDTALPSGN